MPPAGNNYTEPNGALPSTGAGFPAWQQMGAPFASRIARRTLSFASRLDQRIRPNLALRQHPWRPVWRPDDTGLRYSNWAEKLVLPVHTVVVSLMSRLERTLSSTEDPIRFAWAAPLRGILGNILARTDQRHPGYHRDIAPPEITAGYQEDAETVPQTGISDGDTGHWPEEHGGTLPQPVISTADIPGRGSAPAPTISSFEAAAGSPEEPADKITPPTGTVELPPSISRTGPPITRQFLPAKPPAPAGKAEGFSAAVQRRVQPPRLFSGEQGGQPSSVPQSGERPKIVPSYLHETATPAESAAVPGRPDPVVGRPIEQYSRPEMIQDSDAVIKGPPPAPAEEMPGLPHKSKTADEPGVSMPVAKHYRLSQADNVLEDSSASQPGKVEKEETPISLTRPNEPAREEGPVQPAAKTYDIEEGQGIVSTPPLDTGRRQTTAAGSTLRGVVSPALIFPRFPILSRAESRIQPRRPMGPAEAGSEAESGLPASFRMIEEDFKNRFNMPTQDHPAYQSPSWTQKSTAAFLDSIISPKEKEANQEYSYEGRYIAESAAWTGEDMPTAVPAFMADAVAGTVRRPVPQEALTLPVAAPASRTTTTRGPGIAMAPLDRPAEDSGTVIQRAADTSAPAETGEAGPAEVDIEALARDVYQIIRRRLVLEKERRAFGC